MGEREAKKRETKTEWMNLWIDGGIEGWMDGLMFGQMDHAVCRECKAWLCPICSHRQGEGVAVRGR